MEVVNVPAKTNTFKLILSPNYPNLILYNLYTEMAPP